MMKASKALAGSLALTLLLNGCAAAPAGSPAPSGQPSAGAAAAAGEEGVRVITLSSAETGDGWDQAAQLDGEAVPEYDYVWHADPGEAHDEVEDAPAEYYTGTAPSGEDAVYIARDIFYYPELPQEGFELVDYDGEREWAYSYTAAGYEDLIFATLPAGMGGDDFPAEKMHTPEEAYQNAVLHITQPGTYRLEGTWHGQIWIDLGDRDETFADPQAKVTLLLGGVDVTCTVAPALVFYSLYECDNAWEDRESYTYQVDTSDAGARVVVLDGTENNFTGTNVYRMLKTDYKKDGVTQKKLRKTDAAFYSYVSMNIDGGEEGTGVLNVTSGFEGLDTELHLSVNGGNLNIASQDDGVNVNEDGVSVVAFNGGNTHILAGLGREGDGVDSNGFLAVNGGTVISLANPASDAGLDSDSGSYINGGTVVALGSTMDWAEADDGADAQQAVMNLRFSAYQSSDEALILTDEAGKVVFAYDPDKDETAGSHTRQYRGAILSSPALRQGESYLLYVGGDVTGTETAGVYDPDSVTGFSEEARQQCWNGTWEGSGRPGGRPPEGFDPGQDRGERPQPPEGFDPGQDRGERPQPPEGFDPGQGRPQGFGPGGEAGEAAGDGETRFALGESVNNFDRVMDYAPEA